MNTDDIIQTFEDFRKSHRMPAGTDKENITHTGMDSSAGNYAFTNKDYDTFLKLYKEYVSTGEKIALVERQKKVGPVVCDIDLKVDAGFGENRERLYNDNHVEIITSIYLLTVKELFKVDNDKLVAYICGRGEEPSCEKNGDYKDGFHLYLPYVPLRVEYRYLLYFKTFDKIKSSKIFDDIPHIEPIDKVCDSSVVYSNGVLMIGSSKRGRNSYKLTHKYYFDSKTNKIKRGDINEYSVSDLIGLTSLRLYDDDASLFLRDRKLDKEAYKIAKAKNYPTDLVLDTVCPELIDILLLVDKRKIVINKKMNCFFPWCA